jgi:hypothetical protein
VNQAVTTFTIAGPVVVKSVGTLIRKVKCTTPVLLILRLMIIR